MKNKTTEKDKENYSDENHVVINCDSVSPKAFLTSNAEPPNPAPKLETRSGYKASPKETSDAAKQSSAHVAIDCTPPRVESCPPAPAPVLVSISPFIGNLLAGKSGAGGALEAKWLKLKLLVGCTMAFSPKAVNVWEKSVCGGDRRR